MFFLSNLVIYLFFLHIVYLYLKGKLLFHIWTKDIDSLNVDRYNKNYPNIGFVLMIFPLLIN